jgi:SNF2 family DNA or RNA helicase
MNERRLFVPRPWQPPIIDHIAEHKRCAIYGRMGCGKTGAVLHALSAVEALDEAPVLILGPKRVAGKTWPDEVHKWEGTSHIDISPIVGTESQRLKALKQDRAFYSTNYEQIPWLVKHFGADWPFKTVIADESTRIKGYRLRGGGRRSFELGRVAHRYTDRWINLTGTPSPKGVKDLWGQMWFIDGGQRLGSSYTAFTERWFRPNHSGYGITPFDFAQEQIQALISDVCLTIDPADYLPIDKVIEHDIVVDMPAKAREKYTEMEKQMYTEIHKAYVTHEIEAVNTGVKVGKCLQMAGGAVYTDPITKEWVEIHKSKLEALESIVEEHNGAPIIVSYQFVHERERILKHFKDARHFDDNPETEDAWNRGEIPMLVTHPESAGHGSNLQEGGNVLVDYSSGWSAIGPMRQFQSGLDRPVFRYRLIMERSIDLLVKARRERDISVQEILLEALKRRQS